VVGATRTAHICLVALVVTLLVPVTGVMSPGLAQAPVRLTVHTYYTPGFATARAFNYVLGEFHKKHPDIQVQHTFLPFAELVPTLLRQALVGDLPEIVFADNPDVLNLVKAGVFADITSLVQTWGALEDFFLGSRYATTLEERVYAIHFSTNNLALYYNQDLFKRAGVAAPPRTWAELLETCRILTEKLRGEGVHAIGFSAIDSEEGTWQFLPFLWSNGGSLLELDSPAPWTRCGSSLPSSRGDALRATSSPGRRPQGCCHSFAPAVSP
jgi:multiple sugar transport system substrate-binding protein